MHGINLAGRLAKTTAKPYSKTTMVSPHAENNRLLIARLKHALTEDNPAQTLGPIAPMLAETVLSQHAVIQVLTDALHILKAERLPCGHPVGCYEAAKDGEQTICGWCASNLHIELWKRRALKAEMLSELLKSKVTP